MKRYPQQVFRFLVVFMAGMMILADGLWRASTLAQMPETTTARPALPLRAQAPLPLGGAGGGSSAPLTTPPTETPGQIFLPLLVSAFPGGTPTCTPSPTATWTPTPTATPTWTPTSTPTWTSTWTPTPTPTPTATACPVDDVSGFYDVRCSNLQHNCPFSVHDPPSENVEVVQDGTALTFHTTAGNITGTIDRQTGDFQASATITEPPCTYGCLSTMTGTFHLGQNPMTFEGKGELDILGPLGRVFCTITYDVAGIRTSCTVYQFTSLPASQPTNPD